MLIVTIRTDKPDAEIGLYEDRERLCYEVWHAHRELSVTLHKKIAALLAGQGKHLEDLGGIVGFIGPGSFTGLRIGLTVANALAYGLNVPIAAAKGEDWVETGVSFLLSGKNDTVALPEYGAPAHITAQKK